MSLDPLRRWEQRIGALPMPSPVVWAALLVLFLGFGVLMGRATGSSVGALAASRAPLRLLVAKAPTATPPSSTPVATTPPPAPEAETTPEASSAPATSSTAKPSVTSGTSSANSPSGSNESSGSGEGSASPGASVKLSAIKHVFVVMLSDEPYASAFGPASAAHYLTETLEKKGELLVRYYAVAHEGLANGIALLSGQGPTDATAANCPTYSEIAPGSSGEDGQVLGNGCVYPRSTQTLMGQLTAKHLSGKAYVEGIDAGVGTPGACAHPASGATDPSALAGGGQAGGGQAGGGQAGGASGGGAQSVGAAAIPGYQTWRNPLVYFGSLVGSSSCSSADVGMGALKSDLANEKRTASFSYIAPGPCDDGSPTPCAPGKTPGMVAADGFLRKVVPQILASKAYKKDGLLAITVDDAPSSGEYADSSSCCGQPPRFPNLPAPTGVAKISPQGGGQVGLLLLSPFIKKGGGLAQETYNHFSLLATVEQIFGLGKLGYAALPAVKPLSASLLSGG